MNVISYYPTYSLLDSILSYSKSNTLNIYIDLKNVAKSLFIEDVVVNLVESTKRSRRIDSSIFTSFLNYIAFHKEYSLKREIDINFYVFFEMGQSYYHKNIDKNYKANREIDELFGLDKVGRELFTKINQSNLKLIERVFNRVPNVKVLCLEHFEADFIPYYLIKKSLVNDGCNVIYSTDHDMYQTLNLSENIFQYARGNDAASKRKIIMKNQIMKTYLKSNVNIPDEYFILSMAVMGDKGDNVPKVKGIGPKTIIKIIDQLVKCVEGMDNLYSNVMSDKPIFRDNIENEIDDKAILSIIENERKNSIISKNLKLTSFEIISSVFDNPPTTEILDKRKKVHEVLNNKKIIKSNVMCEALEKLNIDFDTTQLYLLYANKKMPFG